MLMQRSLPVCLLLETNYLMYMGQFAPLPVSEGSEPNMRLRYTVSMVYFQT